MKRWPIIEAQLARLQDHIGACFACGKITALDPDGICIDCYMTGGGVS